VPTVGVRLQFAPTLLARERRRAVRVNGAERSTAQWIGQWLVEAFPWKILPKYFLRYRDAEMGAGASNTSPLWARRKGSKRHRIPGIIRIRCAFMGVAGGVVRPRDRLQRGPASALARELFRGVSLLPDPASACLELPEAAAGVACRH
jgi:hypothetical protein